MKYDFEKTKRSLNLHPSVYPIPKSQEHFFRLSITLRDESAFFFFKCSMSVCSHSSQRMILYTPYANAKPREHIYTAKPNSKIMAYLTQISFHGRAPTSTG